MSEIVAAVLGGFLAAGTGWLLNRQSELARIARLRRLIKQAICDDLENSARLYDKIADEWNKTRMVWFATLDEMRESRAAYTANKDGVHLFENEKLRRRIFDYYLRTNHRMAYAEQLQRRRFDVLGVISQREAEIRVQAQAISGEEQAKLLALVAQPQQSELQFLDAELPKAVTQLVECKAEAANVLRDLLTER